VALEAITTQMLSSVMDCAHDSLPETVEIVDLLKRLMIVSDRDFRQRQLLPSNEKMRKISCWIRLVRPFVPGSYATRGLVAGGQLKVWAGV